MTEPARKTGSGYAISLDRPVATWMIVAAICVFGLLSYDQLAIDLMPELSYPTLTIQTEFAGAAPEEVERELSKPIEESLRTVEDLVSIESVSRAERSEITLDFRWSAQMDEVTQKVRERLDALNLPDEAEKPMVLRYDPGLDPVLVLAISGDWPLAKLRRYTEDEIERALEKVDGVAMVQVNGGEEAIISVELDTQKLAQVGLSADDIRARLEEENISLAGGRLSDGAQELLVRTLSEYQNVDEIAQLAFTTAQGVQLRLDDFARVAPGVKERTVITRFGPHESVEIQVFKEGDANLVEVSEAVRLLLEGQGESQGLIAQLPEEIELQILSDRSRFVRASVNEVVNTAALGGILAVLILFIFLRSPYLTAIVALAIPLSVIATFAALYLAGVTLNIMSLGGLALGIGMLVDNAVVVLESVHRCAEEGDAPRQAALRGVREVGGAVIASTLTTIAVFFPIVFVEGVAGQAFGDLALAVVFSLIASLAVALFFIPMLAARRPKFEVPKSAMKGRGLASWRAARQSLAASKEAWQAASIWGRLWRGPVYLLFAPLWLLKTLLSSSLEVLALAALEVLVWGSRLSLTLGGLVLIPIAKILALGLGAFEWLFERVRAGYVFLLRGALNNKALVLPAVLLLAGATATLVPKLGSELIPTVHQGELILDLRFPVETPLRETDTRAQAIAVEVAKIPGVDSLSLSTGVPEDEINDEARGPNTATITLNLSPSTDLKGMEEQVVERLRETLSAVAALNYEIRRPSLFTLATPVDLILQHDDLRVLAAANEAAMQALEEEDAFAELRSSVQRGYPEINIRLDRLAMINKGLSARQVATAVRQSVQGVSPTRIRQGDRRVDILVRADRRELQAFEDIGKIVVKPATANTPEVSLASIATIEPPTDGPAEIRHLEGSRVARIEITPHGLDLGGAAQQVQDILAEIHLPPGVRTSTGGQSAELSRSSDSMIAAFLLAVFLVYIVMAARFESLRGPLVILMTVPLAGVGVVPMLYLTATPLSVVVFIGLIMLAGIVVNNAIVLVDYILELQGRGMERRQAVLRACELRLRPVLITTATTLFGLTPLALGYGEGAELRTPMALTVMAGLAVSTALTLIVIPAVFELIGGSRSSKQEAPEPTP